MYIDISSINFVKKINKGSIGFIIKVTIPNGKIIKLTSGTKNRLYIINDF